MAKLPRDADPRKVLRALERLGFVVDHVSGGHYAMVHRKDRSRRTTVPFHGKLSSGTLRAVLRETRVALEEFMKVFTIL
jgi:predicted RNA binding protein YcfA (HicA-like mRNA interferase family)